MSETEESEEALSFSNSDREWCPLLTVETEVNEWGLKEYKRKGPSLAWFVGLVVPVQEIFVLP